MLVILKNAFYVMGLNKDIIKHTWPQPFAFINAFVCTFEIFFTFSVILVIGIYTGRCALKVFGLIFAFVRAKLTPVFAVFARFKTNLWI